MATMACTGTASALVEPGHNTAALVERLGTLIGYFLVGT